MENPQKVPNFVEKLIEIIEQSHSIHFGSYDKQRVAENLKKILRRPSTNRLDHKREIFDILTLGFNYPIALWVAIEAATTD